MKKVRRFEFMMVPSEVKPEIFTEHQGLDVLALEVDSDF
jgi:hypothetical protein